MFPEERRAALLHAMKERIIMDDLFGATYGKADEKITDEEAAAVLLIAIDSPLADDFVTDITPEGVPTIDWENINDTFERLSHGEQGLVTLAGHVTGRIYFDLPRDVTLHRIFSRLDGIDKAIATRVLTRWLHTRTETP